MLAHRVIPQLLCRGRQLIKGQRFHSWRSVGVAAQAVRIYQHRRVDELMILDIGATPEKRGVDLALVSELAGVCFSPLTVGGGVRSIKDVKDLLRAGADKVCVNTAAFRNPDLIDEIAERFGSSTLTVSIDCKARGKSWYVVTDCGMDGHIFDAVEWAEEAERRGAGEIVITNIEREGTMDGYDHDLIKAVSEAVNVPVIASGGCESYYDMKLAIESGADAVAVGALFQFTDCTPMGAVNYLHEAGIEVRREAC